LTANFQSFIDKNDKTDRVVDNGNESETKSKLRNRNNRNNNYEFNNTNSNNNDEESPIKRHKTIDNSKDNFHAPNLLKNKSSIRSIKEVPNVCEE
jgi:hypothetical protein